MPAAFAGKITLNVLPTPSLFSTSIRPRWASTISLLWNRPIPCLLGHDR